MKYQFNKNQLMTMLAAISKAVDWERSLYDAHCDRFTGKPVTGLKRECQKSLTMIKALNELQKDIVKKIWPKGR